MSLFQSGSLRVLGDRSGNYAHKNGYSSGIRYVLPRYQLNILNHKHLRVNGSPWHYDAFDNSGGHPRSFGTCLKMVISLNVVISFPNKVIFYLIEILLLKCLSFTLKNVCLGVWFCTW